VTSHALYNTHPGFVSNDVMGSDTCCTAAGIHHDESAGNDTALNDKEHSCTGDWNNYEGDC
jgi:hypothetical protein